MNNVVKTPAHTVQNGVKIASEIRSYTSNLDKAVKTTLSYYDAYSIYQERRGIHTGFHKRSSVLNGVSALRSFKGFVGSTAIINRAKDWFCRGDNGKYRWAKGGEWSTVDTIGNACLAGAHASATVLYGEHLGIYSLGKASLLKIGKITAKLTKKFSVNLLLELKFAFYLVLSVCELWSTSKQWIKYNAIYKKNYQNCNLKKRKWQQLAEKDQGAIQSHYQNKIATANDELDNNTELDHQLRKRLEVKKRFWEKIVAEVQDHGSSESLKSLCDKKVEAHDINLSALKRSRNIKFTDTWMTIARAALSFALGVIGSSITIGTIICACYGLPFVVPVALAVLIPVGWGTTDLIPLLLVAFHAVYKPKLYAKTKSCQLIDLT